MSSILVVDDEPGILRLLSLALERAGYSVVTALNAEKAIEACQQQPFDILVTDVRMPGMNGHELARWVAQNYPDTRTILMSGYDLECEACAFSPRCVLLSKPFRVEQLMQMLNHNKPQPA